MFVEKQPDMRRLIQQQKQEANQSKVESTKVESTVEEKIVHQVHVPSEKVVVLEPMKTEPPKRYVAPVDGPVLFPGFSASPPSRRKHKVSHSKDNILHIPKTRKVSDVDTKNGVITTTDWKEGYQKISKLIPLHLQKTASETNIYQKVDEGQITTKPDKGRTTSWWTTKDLSTRKRKPKNGLEIPATDVYKKRHPPTNRIEILSYMRRRSCERLRDQQQKAEIKLQDEKERRQRLFNLEQFRRKQRPLVSVPQGRTTIVRGHLRSSRKAQHEHQTLTKQNSKANGDLIIRQTRDISTLYSLDDVPVSGNNSVRSSTSVIISNGVSPPANSKPTTQTDANSRTDIKHLHITHDQSLENSLSFEHKSVSTSTSNGNHYKIHHQRNVLENKSSEPKLCRDFSTFYDHYAFKNVLARKKFKSKDTRSLARALFEPISERSKSDQLSSVSSQRPQTVPANGDQLSVPIDPSAKTEHEPEGTLDHYSSFESDSSFKSSIRESPKESKSRISSNVNEDTRTNNKSRSSATVSHRTVVEDSEIRTPTKTTTSSAELSFHSAAQEDSVEEMSFELNKLSSVHTSIDISPAEQESVNKPSQISKESSIHSEINTHQSNSQESYIHSLLVTHPHSLQESSIRSQIDTRPSSSQELVSSQSGTNVKEIFDESEKSLELSHSIGTVPPDPSTRHDSLRISHPECVPSILSFGETPSDARRPRTGDILSNASGILNSQFTSTSHEEINHAYNNERSLMESGFLLGKEMSNNLNYLENLNRLEGLHNRWGSLTTRTSSTALQHQQEGVLQLLEAISSLSRTEPLGSGHFLVCNEALSRRHREAGAVSRAVAEAAGDIATALSAPPPPIIPQQPSQPESSKSKSKNKLSASIITSHEILSTEIQGSGDSIVAPITTEFSDPKSFKSGDRPQLSLSLHSSVSSENRSSRSASEVQTQLSESDRTATLATDFGSVVSEEHEVDSVQDLNTSADIESQNLESSHITSDVPESMDEQTPEVEDELSQGSAQSSDDTVVEEDLQDTRGSETLLSADVSSRDEVQAATISENDLSAEELPEVVSSKKIPSSTTKPKSLLRNQLSPDHQAEKATRERRTTAKIPAGSRPMPEPRRLSLELASKTVSDLSTSSSSEVEVRVLALQYQLRRLKAETARLTRENHRQELRNKEVALHKQVQKYSQCIEKLKEQLASHQDQEVESGTSISYAVAQLTKPKIRHSRTEAKEASQSFLSKRSLERKVHSRRARYSVNPSASEASSISSLSEEQITQYVTSFEKDSSVPTEFDKESQSAAVESQSTSGERLKLGSSNISTEIDERYETGSSNRSDDMSFNDDYVATDSQASVTSGQSSVRSSRAKRVSVSGDELDQSDIKSVESTVEIHSSLAEENSEITSVNSTQEGSSAKSEREDSADSFLNAETIIQREEDFNVISKSNEKSIKSSDDELVEEHSTKDSYVREEESGEVSKSDREQSSSSSVKETLSDLVVGDDESSHSAEWSHVSAKLEEQNDEPDLVLKSKDDVVDIDNVSQTLETALESLDLGEKSVHLQERSIVEEDVGLNVDVDVEEEGLEKKNTVLSHSSEGDNDEYEEDFQDESLSQEDNDLQDESQSRSLEKDKTYTADPQSSVLVLLHLKSAEEAESATLGTLIKKSTSEVLTNRETTDNLKSAEDHKTDNDLISPVLQQHVQDANEDLPAIITDKLSAEVKVQSYEKHSSAEGNLKDLPAIVEHSESLSDVESIQSEIASVSSQKSDTSQGVVLRDPLDHIPDKNTLGLQVVGYIIDSEIDLCLNLVKLKKQKLYEDAEAESTELFTKKSARVEYVSEKIISYLVQDTVLSVGRVCGQGSEGKVSEVSKRVSNILSCLQKDQQQSCVSPSKHRPQDLMVLSAGLEDVDWAANEQQLLYQPTEPEWFEDDLGLPSPTSAQKSPGTPVGAYYYRAVPNKPPPPYTPPQGPMLERLVKMGHIPPLWNLPQDKKQVNALLESAAKIIFPQFCESTEKVPFVDPSSDYLEAVTKIDAATTQNEIAYKRFIFDLAKEHVYTHFSTPKSLPPWKHQRKLYNPKPKTPSDVATFCHQVQSLVGSSLNQNEDNLDSCLESYLRHRAKKQDVVDKILLLEMAREEDTWVDYQDDEASVKCVLAEAVFSYLVDETVQTLAQPLRFKFQSK